MAKIKPPTKNEKERWEAFKDIGCIASYLCGFPRRGYDIHHLIEGYRMGHRFTIPLSPWHHRGVCNAGMGQAEMEAIYGPSMKLNKRKFIEVFGTERHLCEEIDKLIGWPAPEWPRSKTERGAA